MSRNYNEPEDLLSDESFLSWYFRTGIEGNAFWSEWIALHPDHKRLAEQAIVLLKTTVSAEIPLRPGQRQKAEEALFSKLNLLPPVEHAAPKPPMMPLYSLFRGRRRMVAAAVFLLLGAGVWMTATRRGGSKGSKDINTTYGQVSRQVLPDGTVVTMNANSRLRYKDDWKDGADREVSLNGEAFFHVSRTPLKSRFIVHTDHFYIVVTGTQFNVVNRPGTENVLLKEGSVIVGTCKENELIMKPGDFVVLAQAKPQRKIVQPDSLMAWQDHKLIFDKTPLRDLVTIIDNQYGVHIQLGDASIGDSTISAMLPNDNLEILLRALKATSDFDVVREGDQIMITSHSGQK